MPNIDIATALMLGQNAQGGPSKGEITRLALALLMMALAGDDEPEEDQEGLPAEVRVVDRAIPMP